MSKRKNGEGRGEQVDGGASKKIKTTHPGAAEPTKSSINQEPAHRRLRTYGKFARKESWKKKRQQKIEAAGEKDHSQQTLLESPRGKSKQHSRRKETGWQVSDAVGGYLVDFDPVFSVDEKYVSICSYV